MKKLREVLSRRKWSFWLRLGLCLLLCLGAAACSIRSAQIRGTLLGLQTAQRWRGESQERFAQISCYLSVDKPLEEDSIRSFRQTLDQKMVEASLEAPENGSLYADAYSGYADITISRDSASAQVRAVGVGGNYFLFHPLTLLSGNYISEDDLMQDQVVLDEETAWQLFGGTNVAGLEVSISGQPFQVAGVISRETDFATKAAYTEGSGIYMSFSKLHELTDAGILWYEVVMPDPIDGFALGVVKDNFSLGSGDVVDNTRRYDSDQLLKVATSFGHRSMRLNGVLYPYWENAARLTEDDLALLLVLELLLLFYPAVEASILLVRWVILGWRKLKKALPAWVDKKEQEKREKEYAARGGERG